MNNRGQTLSAGWIALIFIGIFLVAIAITVIASYNSLVSKDVGVQNQWGKVQSAYQRRLDLIPNIVATVKGSVDFEKTTQTQIATLRSQINSAKNPNDMKQVDSGVSDVMRNINIQVEAYPELKSTANFLALQDELAGTENRVKWERDNFNNAVRSYQTATRTFPSGIFAKMFGFETDRYSFFEATEGADKPVEVKF